MLTREQAEMLSRFTGRKLAAPEQIIDRALASQGMSRSQRRKLIKALKASAPERPETDEDDRYEQELWSFADEKAPRLDGRDGNAAPGGRRCESSRDSE